jgi:hypothetical protein
MSIADGDFSKLTRLSVWGWEWDWERAWCGGRAEGRLLRGCEVGRAVRCGGAAWPWLDVGRGCEAEVGKACLRLAELPGLLMKRSDSMAVCSRTSVCGETSMASDMALRWRAGAR